MRYWGSCASVSRRMVEGIQVDQICKAALSLWRQITSSRQSPRMSPLSDALDLVPLLEETPGGHVFELAGSRSKLTRPPVPPVTRQSEMVVPSSSSRSGSASHQTPELVNILPGLAWMTAPVAL